MSRQHGQLPKRNTLDDKYKWNLSDLIPSMEDWKIIYEDCLTLSKRLESYKGLLLQDAKTLLEALSLRDQLSIDLERLYVYSHMTLHQDTRLSDSQSLAQKAAALESKLEQSMAFIEPELTAITQATLETYMSEVPELATYSHYFDNLLRKKAHILSKEQEELLSKANDLTSSIENIFAMFNEADIKFPMIKDEEGNEVELTKGRYLSFLESNNRTVRKAAFEALMSTYQKHQNTLAAIYTSHLKKHIFYKDARHFSSSIEAALFENNIDTSVYDQLIATVHDYLPVMHRYVALRKKALGVDKLHFYDLYTPIIKDVATKISYEEAKSTVKKALSVLGDEYISLLEHAFDHRWIDVYENEGKRSGAYSWGTYSTHPYVLLNHDDSLKNMFTLAHEMGHALHSHYSTKTQAYINSHYKIFLAEVASTVNEALLMAHLQKTTEDSNMKLYLLNYFMEQFRGTVFRQTMFAEFEKTTHALMEQGEPLTAERLNALYLELNVKYYGPDIEADPLIAIEWARIPHFYYNFYVYQYATGYTSAITLSQKILNQGHEALAAYMEFLSSGGSDYPLNLLKKAGVDMTTPAPIASALEVFKKLVSEMEETLS